MGGGHTECGENGANHALAIGVHPAILFWDRHQLIQSNTSALALGQDTINVQIVCLEAEIECFQEDGVSHVRIQMLEHDHDIDYNMFAQGRWQIRVHGINPTKKEVVVSIRQAFD